MKYSLIWLLCRIAVSRAVKGSSADTVELVACQNDSQRLASKFTLNRRNFLLFRKLATLPTASEVELRIPADQLIAKDMETHSRFIVVFNKGGVCAFSFFVQKLSTLLPEPEFSRLKRGLSQRVRQRFLVESSYPGVVFDLAPFYYMCELKIEVDVIGRGSFGFCRRCRVRSDPSREYVIKEFTKVPNFLEYYFSRKVGNHPNIVPALALVVNDTGQPCGYIMPYCEFGTLHSFMKIYSSACCEHLYRFIAEALSALSHLHQNNLYHNDVKANNILLCRGESPGPRVIARLSDFGCGGPLMNVRTRLGREPDWTNDFYAPERYHYVEGMHYGLVDVFGFGVMLCRFVTAHGPELAALAMLGNLMCILNWRYRPSAAMACEILSAIQARSIDVFLFNSPLRSLGICAACPGREPVLREFHRKGDEAFFAALPIKPGHQVVIEVFDAEDGSRVHLLDCITREPRIFKTPKGQRSKEVFIKATFTYFEERAYPPEHAIYIGGIGLHAGYIYHQSAEKRLHFANVTPDQVVSVLADFYENYC